MAEKRRAMPARVAPEDKDEPSKEELQRRMEEARESISHTVEDIKETVTDQYKSVKETVADVLDWNEHFSKNPLLWGIGAVSVGLIIGYSIAVARHDPTPRRKRRDDDDAPSADVFFANISRLGRTVVLPAVSHKIKDLIGIDISEYLLSPAEEVKPKKRAVKGSAKKRSTKKSSGRKSAAKKRSVK